MTNAAELSSLGATVEELTRRMQVIAGSYEADHRDDLVAEVHEIERALEGAARRIRRLVSSEGA
jgi:hypothetical protein